MNSLPLNITQHAYLLLFAVVFAQAVGLPVPAPLALLIAGGNSAHGSLHFGFIVLTSVFGLCLGDVLLFLLGRHTGWWLLGILCRLSFNPDSCILRSAESFRRNGSILLVFAKFVPGINTLGPPLAGSMSMSFGRFFALDLTGAVLYGMVWSGVGFVFSPFLVSVTRAFRAGSRILLWVAVAAVAVYLAYHLWLWLKAGPVSYVPRVSASEVARHFYSDLHKDIAVFDTRSHGYYNNKAVRIKNSIRLEPNTLAEQIDRLPKHKEIVLYCTCQREATSLTVARTLQEHGFRASVIQGGLKAWKRGDYPLEVVPADDVVLMPTF